MLRNPLARIKLRHLALILIIVVATLLDLRNLGSQSLWYDEALSNAVANSHGAIFVELAFAREASMAFYYQTLHLWLMLVPSTDFNIRLPSIIFAVAALPVLYLIATKLFSPAIGLVAAILLAVNPFFLSYAQEARGYTLAVLLSLLSWLFIIESCREPRPSNLLKYVCATTLAIYSHNLAMLILPAQAAAVLCLRRDKKGLVRIGAAMFAVSVLILPLFYLAAHFYSHSGDWIATSIGASGLASVRKLMVSFVGGIAPPPIRQRPLEALFVLGLCMFLYRPVNSVRYRREDLASYVCVAAAFVIPVALLWSVSRVFPMFIPRYMLICLPFLLIMVAAGWMDLSSRWVVFPGLALMVLLNLWGDQAYYSNPTKPEWRKAIAYVTDHAHYGDKLIFAPGSGRFEFDYNLKSFHPRNIRFTLVYPRWNSRFEVDGRYIDSPEDVVPMKAALFAHYDRVWIVESRLTGDLTEELLNQAIQTYAVVRRRDFRGISVIFCSDSG